MLNKESKIRILENFISLDYLFFGKSIHEMQTDSELSKQYIELKGTLSAALIEMYSSIEHQPVDISTVLNESDIETMAINASIVARSNVKKILTTSDGKNSVTNKIFSVIREDDDIDVNDVVNYHIQEKAFQLGMDNLLIARSLSESIKPGLLESFEGKIVEDTYKSLRDALIETALIILEK